MQNPQRTGCVDFTDQQSSNDYYPFGSTMAGRGFSQGTYRFGFNGQESTDVVYGQGTLYDFKFREHDTRICRFWSVDPLMKEYPWNSPYAFAENRVIDGIELEGLEVRLFNKGKNPFLYSAGSKIKVTNTIHIFAHGSSLGIADNRVPGVTTRIKTADAFETLMDKESDVWKNKENHDKEDGPIIVVFHACRSAEVVEKISESYPDIIMIAPEFKTVPSKDKGTATYASEEAEEEKDLSVLGVWNVYIGGVKVGNIEGRIKPEYITDALKPADLNLRLNTRPVNTKKK